MAIKLIVPLSQPYIITQLFGENVESYKQWTPRGHNGIDYAVQNGTPVMAATGTVSKVTSENGGYGNYVMVSHVDGNKTYHTYYAHLQSAAVIAGQKVEAGTVIGYSNNTGNSTGPHLHFSLKIDGADPYNLDYVDPMPYITGGTVPPDYPDAVALPDLPLEVINVADVRKGPGTQYGLHDERLNQGVTITGRRLRSDSMWVEFEPGKWCALAHEGYVYLKVNSISETSQPSSGATDYPDAVPLPDILFEVDAGVLNVRTGPGTTYENPNQQQLHAGDKITGRRLHSKSVWIEFESGKWCALVHEGVVYLKTKVMTPPPPPPPDFPDAVSLPSLAFEVLVGGDVRQGPGDQYTTNGKLDPGVTITGTRLHSNSVWIEFEPGKWYALAHAGKVYLKAKDVIEPPPPPPPDDPDPKDFPNSVPLLGLSFNVLNPADVRQGPGINYPMSGKLAVGTKFTGKRLQFQSIDIWIEIEQGRWYPFLLTDVFYLEVLGVKKLSPPTSVPTFSPDAVPLPIPLSFEVIRDKISIRQTPDTDIAGIGQLQLGNKLTGGRLQIQPNGVWIETKKGEWCPFVFKNINGKYVVALQLISP